MKKVLMLLLVFVLSVSMLAGCSPAEEPVEEPEVEEPEVEEPEEEPVEIVEYIDGTYEGVSDAGMHEGLKVVVTVEGGVIANVEVVEHGETEGFYEPAVEEIPAAIVAANSPSVDTVSGATFTSEGIIDAVKIALAKAVEGGDSGATEAGEIVKLGLGQNIKISSSKEKTADDNAQAQADVTIAAVGFDAEGKVASVTIDVAQTRVAFDENMAVTSDRDAEVKSKKDLKEDYGMTKASEIGKEWYEQMEAFENWMIGKTVDEITGIPVKERDENHKNVPDVPELTSTVTITVEGYLAAVEEAWENAVDAEGAETVGLGVETHIGSSKDGTADAGAVAQADTYMSATAFDADGKVVATIIDNAQVKVPYEVDGTLAVDTSVPGKTKHELKEDYGMTKASEIGKEWYEQMEVFQDWMVGKDIDEITGLKVKERDENHKNVPDVPELTSTVTITVEGYLSVVEEAAEMAR